MSGFSSVLTVNSLFWFTSLEANEQGVTRRIQEDLIPYLDGIGLHHWTYEPRTANQFLGILNQIAREATTGRRPLLHFDMHGDGTHGIKLAGSGEFVSWPLLVASLREINVATGNNLCVVSGACYSLNAVWQVTLLEACPFFILIAPGEEVSSGFLEDNTVAFYKSVFAGLEIVAAYERHLAPHLSLHHCERMLAYTLASYVQDFCIGKRGNERREELITKAVWAGLAHNRHALRRIRREAKTWTRPNPAIVKRFAEGHASTFLMGKPLGFDIADVMKIVKSDHDELVPALAKVQRLSKPI